MKELKDGQDSLVCGGRPDHILAYKSKALKDKLKEWSRSIQGNLGLQKQNIPNQLAELDEILDHRNLSEVKLDTKADLSMKFEEITKHEELA